MTFTDDDFTAEKFMTIVAPKQSVEQVSEATGLDYDSIRMIRAWVKVEEWLELRDVESLRITLRHHAAVSQLHRAFKKGKKTAKRSRERDDMVLFAWTESDISEADISSITGWDIRTIRDALASAIAREARYDDQVAASFAGDSGLM